METFGLTKFELDTNFISNRKNQYVFCAWFEKWEKEIRLMYDQVVNQ